MIAVKSSDSYEGHWTPCPDVDMEIGVFAVQEQEGEEKATTDWMVAVRSAGVERLLAICPFRAYAEVVADAIWCCADDPDTQLVERIWLDWLEDVAT